MVKTEVAKTHKEIKLVYQRSKRRTEYKYYQE